MDDEVDILELTKEEQELVEGQQLPFGHRLWWIQTNSERNYRNAMDRMPKSNSTFPTKNQKTDQTSKKRKMGNGPRDFHMVE